MSNETYHNYLTSRFGFGKKTKIDVPGEAKGKVLQPEKWGDIERANIAFGQGIAVSSIQLAQAVSIIANGGNFVEPYLVKSIDSSNGKNIWKRKYTRGNRVLRYETSKKMRRMLQTVVERGAKRARIKGVSVSGKTGTAQKVINGKYSKKNIVSMIGFLPSENPQLVVIITIDEPKGQNAYGGVWAAPVFRDAMEKIWLNEDNAEKLANNDNIPSFIGIGKREAIRIAETKKMKIRIHGNGFVQRQDPIAGEKYESNDEIRLFLEPSI
jgi:cell division protein FtsI/penicillin-binding protein 2